MSVRFWRSAVLASLLTAICGTLALSIFLLWPAWLDYRERRTIEPKLRELTLKNQREIEQAMGKWDQSLACQFPRPDGDIDSLDISAYAHEFHVYAIIRRCRYVTPRHGVLIGVEAYRLTKLPASYSAVTDRGRELSTLKLQSPALSAYCVDFLAQLAGRSNAPGIACELLKSDQVQDIDATVASTKQYLLQNP